MLVSLDELRHRTVLDSAGFAIGEVDALLLDAQTWHVDVMRVKLRKDVADQAGVASSLFRKPHIGVSTRHIQSVGDAVILSVKVDSLRDDDVERQAPPPHG